MEKPEESAAPAVTAAVAEPSSTAVEAAASAPTFARRKNRGNIRKRPGDGDDSAQVGGDDNEDSTQVQRKAKQLRGEPLAFSSKQQQGSSADVQVAYESDKRLQSGTDTFVTKMLETETETDRDARALRERVLAQATEGTQNDGKYRGMNNYVDYRQGFRREHSIASEKGTGSHGPLRANMYVRMTALMDYNPSLCKDYKETGFCSYGDSCKFMHDRGDYKQSWELDRDWEEEQKRKAAERMRALEDEDEEGQGKQEEEEEEDDLPFACFLCRKPWAECRNPVVTRCKHYFCEPCALKHNTKTGKCAVCEQATQGIFNVAHDIVKKLKKAKARGA